jgi:hypothetical protein
MKKREQKFRAVIFHRCSSNCSVQDGKDMHPKRNDVEPAMVDIDFETSTVREKNLMLTRE